MDQPYPIRSLQSIKNFEMLYFSCTQSKSRIPSVQPHIESKHLEMHMEDEVLDHEMSSDSHQCH